MNSEPRMVKVFKGNGSPMRAKKPNRNAKCVCGSGKKQKHCCGDETKYYDTKPTVKEPQNPNITESN